MPDNIGCHENIMLTKEEMMNILNLLVNYMTTHDTHSDLDQVFEALVNKHRREIIYVLGLQPYSISQLATMRHLSLPAIHKHIKILENANMIKRNKEGQTNYLTLNKQSLRALQDWLMQYHTYWGSTKETLENYAQYLTKKPTRGGEDA
jgi:DNA-binding transcriptional ArsR family regulator